MSDRELDAAVATEVMEWRLLAGDTWVDDKNKITHPSFRPSKSIAAAWLVEERIEEMGLIEEYCMHLNEIANAHWDEGKRQPQRWQLIHATPEDRCQAALMAAEAEK